MKRKLVLLVGVVVLLCPLAGYSARLPCYQAVQACSAFANDWYASCILLGDYDCLKRAQALYEGCLTAHGCPPAQNTLKGKTSFNLLALVTPVVPTLIDQSDFDPFLTFPPRYTTQEVIQSQGYVEGTQTLSPGHAPELGLYDENVSTFEFYPEGTGGYFVTEWIVRAIVTPNGLQVWRNHELLYDQNVSYGGLNAEVRVSVFGDLISFRLDGQPLFSFTEPGLQARLLHGYYYDSVIEHMIGVPSGNTCPGRTRVC